MTTFSQLDQQMIQSMVRSGMALEQVALVTGMAISEVEGFANDVVKDYLE